MRRIDRYLDSLILFGIKLGLEQTRQLAASVGSPEQSLRFVHIAGSNGKGSVGAMLQSMLRRAGLKTGFYTSPHLIDFSERIRIDGRAVSDEVLDRAFTALHPAAEAMAAKQCCPTYFEFTTVLALKIFAEAKCDVVLWETGMGGRFDATNIVTPLCSIITGIALEHQQYLGDTLAKIAFEKAGIIKENRPVFLGSMPQEAEEVIRARAHELNAPVEGPEDRAFEELHFERGSDGVMRQVFLCGPDKIRLRLAGSMQRTNVRCALPVLRYLAKTFDFDAEDALRALDTVRWPARCDELPSGEIIDGGHNPDGLKALSASLSEMYPGEKFTVIFGAFSDKDVSHGIIMLENLAARFFFVPIDCTFRASAAPEELARHVVNGRAFSSLAAAWTEAHCEKERILLAGSLHLAGEALALYAPREYALNI